MTQWHVACRYEDGCEFVVPCDEDGEPTTPDKARMIQHVATRHPREFFEGMELDCESVARDMDAYLRSVGS